MAVRGYRSQTAIRYDPPMNDKPSEPPSEKQHVSQPTDEVVGGLRMIAGAILVLAAAVLGQATPTPRVEERLLLAVVVGLLGVALLVAGARWRRR